MVIGSGVGDPRPLVIIGAAKAGTTSLFYYLAQHPDLFPSSVKETKFFLKETPSTVDLAQFKALFAGRTTEKWIFEASPHYALFPRYWGVADRLHRTWPDARLLYILRDPVERICSHYLYDLGHGRQKHDFKEAVFAHDKHYTTGSRYCFQLQQYLPYFSRDRIKVLFLEELQTRPHDVLRDVFDFLEVDSTFRPDVAVHNENRRTMVIRPLRRLELMPHYKRLPRSLRTWIRTRFRTALPRSRDILTPEIADDITRLVADDVRQLREFLGRDLPWPRFASPSSSSAPGRL